MPIVPSYFIYQFVKDCKVDKDQITNEYNRILKEHGDSEAIKTEFVFVCFAKLITQFKNELPKDSNFATRITSLYDNFIKELQKQRIDSSKIINEKNEFLNSHIQTPSLLARVEIQPKVLRKTEYKSYNHNTKYGRRKNRQQMQRIFDEMPAEKKAEINSYKFIIILIICLIMWMLLGTNGFFKWIRR